MAAPPDINAILAALAAQNQAGGTPSQQPTPAPQVGLPPGFPGAYPQPAGAPSLGGFQLPQPTSSGSVDISSVRPVSTGSVSIAEAIAKARSIAADKNMSPGLREDPRHAGRSYRRSRSRSRSPPRREAFRDNFNPYRDERRGDDRRGHGRERSPSPRRVSQSGYGSQDKESETITVKSALVGLIIGRGGENLRRIEGETSARVQFVPAREPGAQQRQCTISGTLRQREAAKREIFQTIEENGGGAPASLDPRGGSRQSAQPPSRMGIGMGGGGGGGSGVQVPKEGETQRQILVPDKTVGLIIGRGGETIRDLQDRSGCHVNIVGENKSINGRRPVNLIGTKEAADKAEALIWEIVDSDTRDPSGGGGGGQQNNRRQQGDPFGGMNRVDEDKITESIKIPSEAVGMVIGKGGESIKDMQNNSGCKINVNQPGNPDVQRQIDLVGTRSAIERAKQLIWDKVDTVQQRDRANGRAPAGDRDDGYGHQQQSSFGQAPATQGLATPGMPPAAAAPPAGGDPNAADPYAAYGGYQGYVAMWYAALAQHGGQQQQQQSGQPQGQ